MIRRLLAGLAAAAALAAPTSAQTPAEINFGIISTESTQALKQDWAVLLEDLQKHLGIRVNAFFAPDYGGIIEAMRFGKVQIAWHGNKSGMEAVDRAFGEVFAQQIAEDGAPGYWSYLFVHRDSPYHSLEDVKKNAKNIVLGFGDSNSTSGYLVPGYYAMALNGLDPKTSFKAMRQANHETNMMAVAMRQVDVATGNNESYEKFARRYPERARELRIIWKSPLIPSDPMVWRRDLDPQLKEKIRAFFLNYGKNEREREALRRIGIAGFKASDNNQLLPIRQLELFRQRLALERDERLPAVEKQTRIADIDRRLAELNAQMAALAR
ncbi:MAG: phosphonate ABC transporter substrate-binding protein [Burkholderiales bacterium]|nr:phosphonate ABC transporter substrate-binding protein [Burkholderiales bacterium]